MKGTKRNKLVKRTGIALLAVLVFWTLLTLWAEAKGGRKSTALGGGNRAGRVLIVYDPDPFYNLDEQVCTAIGRALAEAGFAVTVSTVAAAEEGNNDANFFVFCANTYNWRPDWAITSFIKQTPLQNKKVAAVTLGAGSTGASQKALESLLQKSGAVLLGSRPYWLWRPNDENRTEGNPQVAASLAYAWGKELAAQLRRSGLINP